MGKSGQSGAGMGLGWREHRAPVGELDRPHAPGQGSAADTLDTWDCGDSAPPQPEPPAHPP